MPADPRRVIENLRELQALTGDADGAQRVAWTPTWLRAREWFRTKVADLPLGEHIEHHVDAAGNAWYTLAGEREQALVLGSHLDSVPNGGWLDGCLGVLAGLEVMRGLGAACSARRRSRAGRRLRRIACARIARAFRSRSRWLSAASTSSALAKRWWNRGILPHIWNCTSSRDLCWSGWNCRLQ